MDLLKAALLEERLAASGAKQVDTTAHASVAESLAVVEAVAAQWLCAQPGVTDPDDRRSLRREMNIALVEQHRLGWNRMGRRPDNSGVVRALECECDDPHCVEFVPVQIAALPEPFQADPPTIVASEHRSAG